MISVNEADKIINEHLKSFPIVEKKLADSLNLVLREDIRADRDLPPINKSLMDGIAINYQSWSDGCREFKVEGLQPAGIKALKISSANACTEIMTGAVLTKGCDVVIPIEQVEIDGQYAKINNKLELNQFDHVRMKGADCKKNSKLLSSGVLIQPPQISVIASVGKSVVKVSKKPKLAIISTGDEIVDIDQKIEPFQIRRSNSYFIKAALDQTRLFECNSFHFIDNEKVMRKQIGALLENFDGLILTGGVSKGRKDFVPKVLSELSVEKKFHGVSQKPGRPFWFGSNKEGKPVFALPGNPVSTQVCLYRYVIPHLQSALGAEQNEFYAQLNKDFQKKNKLTFFLPIKLNSNKKGLLEAKPITTGGSGDFASVGKTDGFMEVPASKKNLEAGFCGRVYRW